MGKLPLYNTLLEKNEKFSQDHTCNNRIDTIAEFDKWYYSLFNIINKKTEKSKLNNVNTDNMFRGMGEAKHKLFTSSQRFWIVNNLDQWWSPKKYLEFIKVFLDNARSKLLFKKVFEYYRLSPNQRDFPILSILQHYGAPTPLMDWSYNLDVALFFATENVFPSYSMNEIDQYFSVYQIDKNKQRKNEFTNLLDWTYGSFPQISKFYEWENKHNAIFYISDFEDKKLPKKS